MEHFTSASSQKKGSLEVICGSMFSGKTEELMRRLRRAEYAKQKVLTIKHHIDKRYNQPACIVSHEGRERFAFIIGDQEGDYSNIFLHAQEGIDIVGIDEIHFFGASIVSVIKQLIDQGRRVVVSGLELDFRGEPFLVTAMLMALADEVEKLKAICVVCGKDGHHTQRIINGQPAAYDDPVILVGASEFYQPRCRDCFIVRPPVRVQDTSNDLHGVATKAKTDVFMEL